MLRGGGGGFSRRFYTCTRSLTKRFLALMFIIPVVTRSARHIDVNQRESSAEPPQVLSRHPSRLLDMYEPNHHVDRAWVSLGRTDMLLTGSATTMPAGYVTCRLTPRLKLLIICFVRLCRICLDIGFEVILPAK